MNLLAKTLAGLLLLGSAKSHAALECEAFLKLSRAQQELFVSGLVDGMGTVFGVTDTAARLLKKASKTEEERVGIDKMHSFPQKYMGKNCCLANEEITDRIIKGCKVHPDRPVGNMLTDVMSGEL